MKCPNDQASLQMTERHGIEVDYCPECRGVWLDRGELDKIIDKAGAEVVTAQAAPPPAQPIQPQYREYRSDNHYDERYHGKYGKNHKRRRKESFMDDLFSF